MPPDPRWTPCPSCGRRPSERKDGRGGRPGAARVRNALRYVLSLEPGDEESEWCDSARILANILGDPEPQSCPDPIHDTADASPALYSALEDIAERCESALEYLAPNLNRSLASASSDVAIRNFAGVAERASAALQLAQPAGRRP